MKRPDTLRGRRKGRGLLAGAAAAALLGLQACAPAHDIGVAQVPSAPAASHAARTAEAPSTRPNVLLIISDDLNTRLDTYGGPIAAPNLNNLAADGVAFNEAYSQFPWCGPSRASFLSGLRPSTVGVTDLRTPLRERISNLVTLPQYFRENGYFTARSGKVFHQAVPEGIGKPGADDPRLIFKLVELSDASRDFAEQEKQVAQYVASGKSMLADKHEISMITDKASVASLPLQVSFITTPDGVAVLCCPQVWF